MCRELREEPESELREDFIRLYSREFAAAFAFSLTARRFSIPPFPQYTSRSPAKTRFKPITKGITSVLPQ